MKKGGLRGFSLKEINSVKNWDSYKKLENYKGNIDKFISEYNVKFVHSNYTDPDEKLFLNSDYFRSYFNTFHVSLEKALKENPEETTKATVEEISKLIKMDTFDFISPNEITQEIQDKSIHSFVFVKKKQNSQGQVIKTKSRIVVNGASQKLWDGFDKDKYYSPTCKKGSLYSLLNIASFNKYNIRTVDIGNAFVHSPIQEEIYIKIPANVTNIMVNNIDTNYSKYLCKNGMIYARLNKALYGLVESPALWNNYLNNELVSYGFRRLFSDKCCYTKTLENGNKMYLLVHVDDIMIITKNNHDIDNFINYLKTKFETVTQNEDRFNLDYLGINIRIDPSDHSIYLNQKGLIKSILDDLNVTQIASTPSTSALFVDDKNAKFSGIISDAKFIKEFQSILMRINYLIYSRPDILTSISYLSSRAHRLTWYDFQKLYRLIFYLKNTKDQVLKIKPNNLQLKGYADSSWATHSNGSSQAGYVICFGDLDGSNFGYITSNSNKQKIIAKSSCEAELYSLNDCCDNILFFKQLLNELGYPQNSVPIYQDNKSTISMVTKGNGTKRSKHINIRFFYIHNLVNSQDIELIYLQTDNMIADMYTKSLDGNRFKTFRKNLGCYTF